MIDRPTREINDGGPMFPSEQGDLSDGTRNQTWEPGASVRMWLVGQALSNPALVSGLNTRRSVERCFRLADAMIDTDEDPNADCRGDYS